MTLSYFLSGYLVIGLAADTKPTDVPNGSLFIEYDTNKVYVKNGATYTLNVPASGGSWNATGAEVLQNKTLSTDLNTIKHSTTNNNGDLVANTGTKFDRFAKGASLQVLRVKADGSGLEWANIATTGSAWNPTTAESFQNKTINTDQNLIKDSTVNAVGDIMKSNASRFIRFAKGSAGQILRVKQDGSDLEWFTLANPAGTWNPESAETLKNKIIKTTENTIDGPFVRPSMTTKRWGAWWCNSATSGFEGFWDGLFSSAQNAVGIYDPATGGTFTRLQNPTANGGTSWVRSNALFTSINANPYLKFKIRTNTVGSTRQYYGFTSDITDTTWGNETWLDDEDGVMFHLGADNVTWTIQHNDNGTSAEVNTITPTLTPTDGAVITFEIKGIASSGKWQYAVNGNAFVDLTTNVPLSGSKLGVAFMSMQNTGTGPRYADIFYAEMSQDI